MRGISPPITRNILSKRLAHHCLIIVFVLLCISHNPPCNQNCQQHQHSITFAQAQQRFVDSSTVKPSLVLILPQSFKVPTNPPLDNVTNSDLPKLQQYVVIINNAQDDQEDDKIRRQYKRLSLQVRDARSPITGQLFYEHQFDYFTPNSAKYLLIPINLDQVSVPYLYLSSASASSKLKSHQQSSQLSAYSKPGLSGINSTSNNDHNVNDNNAESPSSISTEAVYKPQQLTVSIRPVQSSTGFESNSIELVSSSPVVVEPVPSSDGRRSFSTVQTDKPIYKPNEKVRIRAMVVNENLRPVVGEELRLLIKNPHKITVESMMFPRALNQTQERPSFEPLFIDHVFEFPPEPMLGKWSVHLLHSDIVANDTTSFEVKEYVLPPFELTLESPKYILPTTQHITGAAIAKYHFGKPVQGKVQFKFGYLNTDQQPKTKFVARSSIKNIDLSTGRVDYNISLEKFMLNDWFPQIAESRLIVEATATDMTSGHRETATDNSCVFMNMPYVIVFDESIEDFKPGLTQHLVVRLMERLSLRPGPAGQRIFAEFRDQNNTILGADRGMKLDTEAITDSVGRAIFKVGPFSEDVSLITVSMKLIDPDRANNDAQRQLFKSRGFTGMELAIGNHTLVRHDSQNGWIALMNKSVTHANVGDRFVSDLLIRDAIILPQKIFYTIVSRGQIITMGTINEEGLVSFQVTEAMMPSMRLVLFALTHDSIGLLSDSMRIAVNQDLDCALKLEYKSEDATPLSEGNAIKPNARGRLDISARQGDLVSLIGVDNAIYSLNNRTRLESIRIIERIRLLDTGCGFGGGKNNLDVFHNAGLMFYKDAASDTLGHIGSSCLNNPMKYVEEAAMGYTKPMLARIAQDMESAPYMTSYNSPKYKSRPKREVDPETILRRYKDPFHRACCRLGTLEDIPQRRNCSIRKRIVEKYMRSADPCSSIYFDCCRQVFGEVEVRLSNMFPGPYLEARTESRNIAPLQAQHMEPVRSFGQLDKIEAETLIRRDFRETWLFDLVKVEDPSGRASLEVQLPHTITSWSISAMALNQYKPMCVMPRPYRINTFQEIFIKLSMPYKIVQGEQIDLVATLYNYSPQIQDVLVYMYGVEDLCSDAEPGERSEQRRVRVDKHSSQAIIFSMIPLKIGQYPIKVVAVTLSSNNSDIIERQLNVVPRGKPVTDETTFSLDPMNQQRRSKRAIQTGNLVDEIDSTRGLQFSTIHLRPTRDSEFIVPETQECIVSAIGDKLGHVVQTSLLDVENLIRLPQGCGEQVMLYLGPTLYTAKYLDSIDKLTGDLRWRAVRYIQSGYKRILNYRHNDGAFSAFPNRYPSVWLTAFVAKMLCQTERTAFIADEIHVDKTVINSALKYLIEKQHKKLGIWIEMNPVYHREMLGGVLKEGALTAFVTLTLNECRHHTMDTVDEVELPDAAIVSNSGDSTARIPTNGFEKLKAATQKAEEALLRERYRAVREKNPYVMALMSYALSFNHPQEAAALLDDLMPLAEHIRSKNLIYWRGRYHIETVAYTLQAIIELAPLVSVQSPSGSMINVKWRPGADALGLANFLTMKRAYTGAFESTQDTVVGLEALAKFAPLQSSPNGNALVPQTDGNPNLSCNVTISNRTRRQIEFDKDNAQILQTFKLSSFDLDPVNGENLEIITSGSGLGTMSVKLKYNVFQADDELCRFDIDSTIEEWKPLKITSSSSSNRENNELKTPINSGETQQGEVPSIEEDFFKTFDKSMLNELNLLDLGQNDSMGDADQPTLQQATQQQIQPKRLNAAPYLRLRRYTAAASEPQASPRAAESGFDIESWTSKMVSNLRAKLPDWIAPKSSSISEMPTTTTSATTSITQAPHNGTPNARRTTTSRRSTQSSGGAPVLTRTTPGIPSDAPLNSLSKQFEMTSYNKTANTTAILELTGSSSQRLVLLLTVCVHHMSTKQDSEMAVIEVGVLSGFRPNEADLREVINMPDTPAMKYELSSDRSLVIIYMRWIPSSVPWCAQFRLVRDSPVYNLQSGYIRAYEYYSPTHSCSNFYTPKRINNLIDTRCDSAGQVCQCASRSLCPATRKLLDLGENHQVNATSARNQLVDLICSNKYDLVSLVRLKSVRFLEAAKMYKLAVKIKSDMIGNLTKIIDEQRQQKTLLVNRVRKPQHIASSELSLATGSAANNNDTSASSPEDSQYETSLDFLNLNIDSSCVRDDPLLLHFAHPNQYKQGGEVMILFARSDRLERKYFKSVMKAGASRNSPPTGGPRPKPNILFNDAKWPQNEEVNLTNSPHAAQYQHQYSLTLPLDKDTILHDITYQARVGPRESINNLLLWAELKSRREKWKCNSPAESQTVA